MFKPGDKIEYIGPPRNELYQHEADHPSYYRDFKILRIVRKADDLIGIPAFVRTECYTKNHGELCGGYRHLRPNEWKVI